MVVPLHGQQQGIDPLAVPLPPPPTSPRTEPALTVYGQFLTDSMALGKPIEYSLVAQYPKGQDVLFPDQNWNYGPFELVEKRWFTTQTTKDYHYDSAVYVLRSFDISPTQGLALPIFTLNPEAGDSVATYTRPDSVRFMALVPNMPDSLDWRETAGYYPVPKKVNVLYWTIGLVLGAVLLGFAIALFYKPALRWWQLRRLQQGYQRFELGYHKRLDKLQQDATAERLSAALGYWKQYLEKLEGRPFTKWSTRETTAHYQDAGLKEALQAIDRTVYGGIRQDSLRPHYERLQALAQEYYQKHREAIRHGGE